MPFVIALVIWLESHLIKDRDFPQSVKVGAWVVLGVLTVVYVLSRVIGKG